MIFCMENCHFVNGGMERTQQPGNGSGDKRLTGRHRT